MYLKYNLIVKNFNLQFQALERDINLDNSYIDSFDYNILINKKKYKINLLKFVDFFNTYLIDCYLDNNINHNELKSFKINNDLTIKGILPKNSSNIMSSIFDLTTLLNFDDDNNNFESAKQLAEIYASKKYNLTEANILFIFLERIIDLVIDVDESMFINKNFNINILFYLFFISKIDLVYVPYPLDSHIKNEELDHIDYLLDNNHSKEYYDSNEFFF